MWKDRERGQKGRANISLELFGIIIKFCSITYSCSQTDGELKVM